MRTYYAFEFQGGRYTTTDELYRGQYSIAGMLACFSRAADRDAWVRKGKFTSDMAGCNRERVKAREARTLCGGATGEQFQLHCQMMRDHDVFE